MKLKEKLEELMGHEVFFTTLVHDRDDEIPAGTLFEIGEDYLIIDTQKEEEAGDVGMAAHWFIRLDTVISVGHPADCRACAVSAAQHMKRRLP